MNTKIYITLFIIFFTSQLTSFAQEEKYITESVKIEGLIEHSFIINLNNIKEFNVQKIETPQNVTCASGEVKKVIQSFKGVLLCDILDSAKVQMPHKKARGEYFVFITASDGYKVIFAWNELYYGLAGKNTWLLFEENGNEIAEDGKFIVLCTSDTVTGPRHVKWVKKIEVKRVEQ